MAETGKKKLHPSKETKTVLPPILPVRHRTGLHRYAGLRLDTASL